MSKRKCIACVTGFAVVGSLCRPCREKYGKYSTWPEWLKFLHDDLIRERKDNLLMSVEMPLMDETEGAFYDAVSGQMVHTRRDSLLDQYDRNGYPHLRGCREEAFDLIDGRVREDV